MKYFATATLVAIISLSMPLMADNSYDYGSSGLLCVGAPGGQAPCKRGFKTKKKVCLGDNLSVIQWWEEGVVFCEFNINHNPFTYSPQTATSLGPMDITVSHGVMCDVNPPYFGEEFDVVLTTEVVDYVRNGEPVTIPTAPIVREAKKEYNFTLYDFTGGEPHQVSEIVSTGQTGQDTSALGIDYIHSNSDLCDVGFNCNWSMNADVVVKLKTYVPVIHATGRMTAGVAYGIKTASNTSYGSFALQDMYIFTPSISLNIFSIPIPLTFGTDTELNETDALSLPMQTVNGVSYARQSIIGPARESGSHDVKVHLDCNVDGPLISGYAEVVMNVYPEGSNDDDSAFEWLP